MIVANFRCRALVHGFASNVLNLWNLRNLRIFYFFGIWVQRALCL